MKKILALVLLVVMSLSLFACGEKTPKNFSGEWKFASIEKVELKADLAQEVIDLLKEQYNAEDEASLNVNARDSFVADGVFTPCYIKFTKNNVYTYDPAMDREATWVLYQLSENTAFISFYTELDASNGNPDPTLYPDLVYNAESNTMLMTINYIGFKVTISFVR